MKKSAASLALCFFALSSFASTPLWVRNAKISPDGKEIAFTYKGDIYKVPASGGTAIQLTTQPSYETSPVWSPDGKKIAFTSDRNGGMDIFVMPSSGGAAKRVTFNSAKERPWAFTPDGKAIVYSATIQDPAASALFPKVTLTELYKTPIDGGRTEQILGTPAEAVFYLPDGKSFLYQDCKGGENEWRKHHTSSITRDICLYDAASGKHTNLTLRPGEDRNPVLSPDGKTVYYLCEPKGGTFNVYSFDLNNPKQTKAVTAFKTHPVRFLSISKDGKLCFGYNGEIYTQEAGKSPQKLKIDIVRDDEPKISDLTFRRGATSATVSPDGKQIAFIVRGDVFVTSSDYSTTKQITQTPEAEQAVTFAPDNRTLAYASERDGNWQLFTAKIKRSEDLNFPNATLIEEEALLPSTKVERSYPQFSPDGKELAFIEGRTKLMVLNLKTKKVRQITDGSMWYETNGGFGYAWSPDGKWFTLEFIGHRHDPYSDIGLVKADGSGKIVNITNSGYFNMSPRFVMDGNAILFVTEKYGMRAHASWGSQMDAMLVFLNQDAFDKYRLSKEDYELRQEMEKEAKKLKEKEEAKDKKNKKDKKEAAKEESKDIKVELENLQDRMVRLTPNSSDLGSVIITKDGKNLIYLCSFEGGYDMWKYNLRDRSTKLLHKMDASWGNLEMDKDGNIYLLGSSNMQKVDKNSFALKGISYVAPMKIDLAAERAYMLDHVRKQVQERFYEKNLHGVDWEGMYKNYKRFLPHINNNYDFAELLSELLGELNVSHTGGMYYAGGSNEPTADLGLFYDWSYKGKGMKVDEIIEKGPFDNARTQLKPGMIIEKINGQLIDASADGMNLLNDKRGKKTLVTIFDPQTNKRWDEVVLPISAGMRNDLLYHRWVKQRAADVEKWSKGRLGYVHIRSMGDESFREVYSDILGKYNNCDGIVIDTRFNGGGRLHEDIEVLFSGKKYFTQVVRGREACDMPSRRWNKPSIMLICEANYSNAHGTPWVYKHRGIGKLVGMPVPGTMTSVSWETLQDNSLIFGIPIIGYQLPDGSYLENSQLEPDFKLENRPETVVKGEDSQLKKAVDELLNEIDHKKSK